jgi:Putative peptidoglycan binding domain
VTRTSALGQIAGTGLPSQASSERHRGPRRWVAVVVVVVVAGGVGAAAAAGAFGRGGGTEASTASSGYRTSTAVVTRRSLTSQTQVDATLGDAGTWPVVVPSASSSGSSSAGSSSSSSAGGSSSGMFTWLPTVGRTVRQGQVIYRVSGSPVVLLYGSIPSYRDLSEGLIGADVRELNTGLVKLGYTTRASLGPRSGWDYYSAATASAVELLQSKLGLAVTGTLSLGQAAFLPGPALITALGSTAALGGPATPGSVVATASSTTPVVSIDLDAAQQSEVKNGDPVSITLPDGSTTPGVISQISRAASSSSSGSTGSGSGSGSQNSGNSGSGSGSGGGSSGTPATITVLVSLIHPKAAGKLNQAPVTVTVTTGSVADVLTVPVDALLARPRGGYAVEVVSGWRHHLVTVTPGMFDDTAGLVQVSGAGLSPGQRVVVPGI